MSIKVLAHKAPDTDATCAPIAYAWYLKNMKKTEAEAFVLGGLNRETEYVLKRFGINAPGKLEGLTAEDKVVIMDTNNPEELPENINESEIIEIIDHHKLVGGLMTNSPIRITMKPIACTSTLVWQRMQEEGNMDIPAEIAGIMMAAIISDTLQFTSPTTTEEDKKAVEELALISKVDVDELAEAMFAAKSDLTGFTAKDVLLTDSKIFEMGSKKVRVSVLETTKPDNAMSMYDDLLKAMEEIKAEDKIDAVFFYVVDILTTSSELLVSNDVDKAIAEKAYNAKFTGKTLHLDGVVSRKKQMVPNLEKAYTA